MPLDEQLSIRIPGENLPLLEKVIEYRFNQGLLRKPTMSEYIRYLLDRDISEVVNEIRRRRS